MAPLLVLGACGSVGGSSPVPAPTASGREVLALTATAGYRHASIPAAVGLLRTLAGRDRRLRVTVLDRAEQLTPARLRGAAAVAFVSTSGPLPLDERQRRALVAFVRRGGGLVGFHAAAATLGGWPTFGRMLGGVFAGHPYHRVGRVVVEDRATPMTRGLPAAWRTDEEFYFFRTDPRRTAHVLLRLDVGSVGGPPRADRPLAWCRREGRGRVFYDALGHAPAQWRDRRQRTLVRGGLAWAAGLVAAPACGRSR